jgi:hypothetical protein
VIVTASAAGVVGVIGVGLWLKLFLAIDSLAMAGNCVIRVGVAPLIGIGWSVAGFAIPSIRRNPWAMGLYVIVGLIVLFFAFYCMLFLSWAVKVWPDQCICSC